MKNIANIGCIDSVQQRHSAKLTNEEKQIRTRMTHPFPNEPYVSLRSL